MIEAYQTEATVNVDKFYLQRTEVTKGAFAQFLKGGDFGRVKRIGDRKMQARLSQLIEKLRNKPYKSGALSPKESETNQTHSASLEEAMGYCARMGGRLPMEHEWHFAPPIGAPPSSPGGRVHHPEIHK